MKIIALEESFWYEKLATEGSTVAHVRVKSAVAADWQRKLVDFTEHRLPDMDRERRRHAGAVADQSRYPGAAGPGHRGG